MIVCMAQSQVPAVNINSTGRQSYWFTKQSNDRLHVDAARAFKLHVLVEYAAYSGARE